MTGHRKDAKFCVPTNGSAMGAVIAWSLKNRFLVVLLGVFLVLGGLWALRTIPLDAIPDLSDAQVIVQTKWDGASPQVMEDQVTQPLSRRLVSTPGAKVVRGYSFFGESLVYVLFDEGTDLYWARSRVLELLSSMGSELPKGVQPVLGPDASGVGWIYEYALVSDSGTNTVDNKELRRLQDWTVKPELQTVAGVAEVASVGGMERQFQVTVDQVALEARDCASRTWSRPCGVRVPTPGARPSSTARPNGWCARADRCAPWTTFATFPSRRARGRRRATAAGWGWPRRNRPDPLPRERWCASPTSRTSRRVPPCGAA